MNSNGKTLLLTDGHAVVRKGIIASIENENTAFEIFEAANYESMKQELDRRAVSHLILDLKLSDSSFLEPLNFVRRYYPDVFVLLFTTISFDLVGETLLKAGASGYLSRQATADEMTYGINHFLSYGSYFPSPIERMEEEEDVSIRVQSKLNVNSVAGIGKKASG